MRPPPLCKGHYLSVLPISMSLRVCRSAVVCMVCKFQDTQLPFICHQHSTYDARPYYDFAQQLNSRRHAKLRKHRASRSNTRTTSRLSRPLDIACVQHQMQVLLPLARRCRGFVRSAHVPWPPWPWPQDD